ncbi:monovalent cation/proton antiporter, MnhG/PhaG subunit [compost metagenome]
MVIASLIYFGTRGNGVSLHELLIALFLFITAPVSAHMLAKAALQQKLRLSERTRGKPWDQ